MNYLQKVKSERDELKAELERVKAERDSALESADIQCNIRYMQTEELESLKSRLPVNRDGDVPEVGDKQWFYDEGPIEFEICIVANEGDGWSFLDSEEHWRSTSICHSSAESCRAAHETEKGA